MNPDWHPIGGVLAVAYGVYTALLLLALPIHLVSTRCSRPPPRRSRPRYKAAATRADPRVREIEPLIDRVNEKRNGLFGELTKRGVERNLARTWPEGIFRVASRREPASSTP